MKRFFLLLPLFFALLTGTAQAKEYTINANSGDTVKITTTTTGAVITYTRNRTGSFDSIISIYSTKDATTGRLSNEVFHQTLTYTASDARVKTITVPNLTGGTTYYLNINYFAFETEPTITADLSKPVPTDALTFDPENGAMKVSGKVSGTYNHPEALRPTIEYSSLGTFSTDLNQKPEGVLSASGTIDPNARTLGVNADGTYFFFLPNIDPVKYWYRQTFRLADGSIVGAPTTGDFNGKNGFAPTTQQQTQDDFEQRSYRLLAPLPGLSVLLDPDLCAEQNIEHPTGGRVCDINSFLDYIFRLLIGLSALILVIRIIIEGFKYATSDVISIKISSKEKLWQGVWGLLLALSAWLILNTINPKLVQNTISLPNVSLSFEEELYQSTIPQDSGTIPSGSVARCTSGIEQIVTKGGKMNVCKSIAASVRTMVDLAWSEGVHLSGGGFRTAAQQIDLRKKHCGIANVFTKGAKCVPPTAYPGNSNHESGLAIDFMCDGKTIATKDNKCFLWLQANAKKYGLVNFAKEPWHWSVDGR